MRRRRRQILALIVAIVASVVLAGCGGSSSSSPSDEELDSIAKEIDMKAPNVGLGEGSLTPSDVGEWKTDFSKHLVPLDQFQSGGPAKDGIPAIDIPRFTAARDIDWLGSREPVIRIEIHDETRGYPLQILVWHEIVNDRIAGVPIAVTFCPLCNTAIAFDRRLDRQVLDFGTTGKLRDSDLVMYDRQTESWWQQFSGDALVGKLTGSRLRQVTARIVSWHEFLGEDPSALVLNRDTGYFREYGANPYAGYDDVESPPLFGARNGDDDRLLPKERVVYIEVGEDAFAVPFATLAKERNVSVRTDEGQLVVRWRPGVVSALDAPAVAEGRDVGATSVLLDGRPVPFMEPFWFAVAAFRPDIEVVG